MSQDLKASLTVLGDLARRALEVATDTRPIGDIHFDSFRDAGNEYYSLHRLPQADVTHHDCETLTILRLAPPHAGAPVTPTDVEPSPDPRTQQRNDLYRAALVLACMVSQTWGVEGADVAHKGNRYRWTHTVASNRLLIDRSDPTHALVITRFPPASGRRPPRRLRALFAEMWAALSARLRLHGSGTARRAPHAALAQPRQFLDEDELIAYVVAHGFAAPTVEGLTHARKMWIAGNDYAAIASELVFRGLVQPPRPRDE